MRERERERERERIGGSKLVFLKQKKIEDLHSAIANCSAILVFLKGKKSKTISTIANDRKFV